MKLPRILGVAALILALTGFILEAAAFNKDDFQYDKDAVSNDGPPRPPMTLNHGGPDGGGYYFIDSDDDASNAPVFEWIDISSVGTEISPWPHGSVDDGYTDLIPMGMEFTFYGITYTDIVVSTNGWVSFLTQTNSYLSNSTIPTAANPNAIIAVEWDDLDGGTVGHCYYYHDVVNDQFIVSWVNWPYYPDATGAPHDLQVILKGNGSIFAQYGQITGSWHASATVGIENETGSIGTQVAYNQTYLRTGLAIYYGLTPPIYASHDVGPSVFVAPPGFGRTGTPIAPVVTFMNMGVDTESFPGHLIINHNGQVYSQIQQISNLAPAGSVDITFPDFTPSEEGTFELVAISELSTDSIPQNDTLRMNYQVYSNFYTQDFESDNGQFTGDNDWQWGPPTNPSGPSAHSGSNVWAVGLTGPYSVGPLLSTLISPAISLGNNAVLTFWQWYNTESGFDGGNVKISTDNGGTWTLITPVEGYSGILSTNFQNPIGGEEAYFGLSNTWVQATFDLSAYGGISALFKLDFGSDISIVRTGWFIDDFVVVSNGGVAPGWIRGVVSDSATHNPVAGAFVSAASRRDTTDSNGYYKIEMDPGTYSVTATALYHNDHTINGVVVVEGDSTLLNFSLTAPQMQVNTAPIDTSLNQGETAVFTRRVSNTGNGPLYFEVIVDQGGRLKASSQRVVIRSPQKSDGLTEGADLLLSDWLAVLPAADTVNAGGSVDLTITVDFTGTDIVPDSTYRGSIQVNANVQAQEVIPVTVRSQSVGIEDDPSELPLEFSLSQNYPNPFNAQTVISYSLPKSCDVTIDIFDLLGKKIETLAEGVLTAGIHQVVWNASGQSSGIYFYRIKAGDKVETRKMVLMK